MNAVVEMNSSMDIVALVETTPALVLTDKERFSEFYSAMRSECEALVIDLETEKGRKVIASMAYKVARTKTAIDDAGKRLNEEARSKINAVDESRREIRCRLDALRDEVRRPLTEWEEKEEARKAEVSAVMEWLRGSLAVELGATSTEVRDRIKAVTDKSFPDGVFQGLKPQAEALKADVLSTLASAAERLEQEEAQRAELERLREEAAEREERDRKMREAAEAERRRHEAEQAAAEAKARSDAEQKAREQAAAKAAEQRAREEVEAKAREERAAEARKHAAALEVEKRRADEAEAARKAEQERIKLEAEAQAEREANLAHRSDVMRAAKEAVMDCGVDEPTAKVIVLAIAAGGIPHTVIKF